MYVCLSNHLPAYIYSFLHMTLQKFFVSQEGCLRFRNILGGLLKENQPLKSSMKISIVVLTASFASHVEVTHRSSEILMEGGVHSNGPV